jgi:hypothetical protein
LEVLSVEIDFSSNRIGEAFDLLANEEYADYRGARKVLGEQLLYTSLNTVAGQDGTPALFQAVRRVLESPALLEAIGRVLESPPHESEQVISGLLEVMGRIERGELVQSLREAQRPT